MRISAADIAFTLVTASLALMSAACADELVADVVTHAAVLHFVNGDQLPGVPLDCDQAGVLEWQAGVFTKPFRFDGSTLAEIRFTAPAVAAADAGEFRFDLLGGDVLLGDLVTVGADELVVDAGQVGRVRLKRSESLRLSRCRGNPALVYQGPNGLAGWGPPEAAATWIDDGGHLATDRDSVAIECDVKLPPQALIELAISWKSQPDFALVLGSAGGDDDARQAFRFEVLDGELIVRRETRHDFDIESVMPLGNGGPGRIHVLALLDQERERLQVLATDGKPLAAIHAAADAPRVRPGIRLEHQHGGLRLELLRVSRYAGRPPHEVTEDAPRVHLTNGSVVYGNIKRYDAGKRRFVLQTEGADETIDVDQVENVFLARPASETAEPEQAQQSPADRKPTPQRADQQSTAQRAVGQAHSEARRRKTSQRADQQPIAQHADRGDLASARVTCVDGTRLTGRFAGIRDGQLQLACHAAFDSVALRVAGLREVRFTDSAAPIRNQFEVALPVLQADGLKSHGKLAPARSQAGASCLAWQPHGSSTSSPLNAGASGRIVFKITAPAPTQGAIPVGAMPVVVQPAQGMPQVRRNPQGRQPVQGRQRMAPAAGSGVPQPQAPIEESGRRVRRGDEDQPDTLYLRAGDVLPCRVTAIDERGVSLKSPFTEASVVPHAWVRAIEFGPQSSPPQLDADKLARLLTLPRAQKLDPPTHVISATNGDYLRGKLTAMDERVLRFEVQGRERELFRDRIARVVWLGLDEDAAAGTPPGCVQAVQLDGARMTFTAEEVDDDWISGEADLLGPCRVRIDQLRELLFGNRVRRAAAKLIYSWKLVDAQTPLAFRTDLEHGGAAAEGADSPLVGQPASDFELPMLDGAKFRLSQRRGTTVVLDFWASWCGPCMQGLPKVAGVVAECDPEKVLLVAVNLQETSVEATDALRRLKLEIAVALDREGKVAKEYGATSIPYTVVIGPDGKIARVFVGTGPQLERQLAEALAELRKAGDG